MSRGAPLPPGFFGRGMWDGGEVVGDARELILDTEIEIEMIYSDQ